MQILHRARGRKRRHDRTTPRDDVPGFEVAPQAVAIVPDAS
jgi:hypothetical protein